MPYDPNPTGRFNPFIVGRTRQAGFGSAVLGSVRDAAFLKRQGYTEAEAMRLAKFASHRGGLDTFESVEAARRAMLEARAGTMEAIVPAAPRRVSRIAAAPRENTQMGAADFIGLPLIRR